MKAKCGALKVDVTVSFMWSDPSRKVKSRQMARLDLLFTVKDDSCFFFLNELIKAPEKIKTDDSSTDYPLREQRQLALQRKVATGV